MANHITKSVRLDPDESEQLAQISRNEGISESALMKRLILDGLATYKIEQAIILYQRGELDLSAAARYADISVYHMMTELEKRDIAPPTAAQKFTEGLHALLERFGGSDELRGILNG